MKRPEKASEYRIHNPELSMAYDKAALDYHSKPVPGKITVEATKPCSTQRDLSLAYTPGVAVPCLKIQENPDDAFKYTSKGNLVAVVSNGTAVLGLGDIGALAGKPVMEGKGVLFKRFANVDVFDIELDTHDADEIIRACELLEPTFGGINLEDIKAPECFYIEETLKERLGIPVFHDDQHGTAIISGAALINAAEIINKDLKKLKLVVNGAGAAGIACAKFYEALGVKHENILMLDSKGVLFQGREDLDPDHPRYNKYKAYFAQKTKRRTLEDAMDSADVFSGVSVKNVVSKKMVQSMAKNPIIMAMANPDPEITYPEAVAARKDVIMATGRSDYPNQVNNVLGFPFIFRGALDVRATSINDSMTVAAANALAQLAKEDVPDSVLRAYGVKSMGFGKEYLIPKPFDPRVLTWESVAVAKAAVESGVARHKISDWDEYRDRLETMLGAERRTIRKLVHVAQKDPHRIVFAEGSDEKVLRASQIILDENIGTPVLLGSTEDIEARKGELGLPLKGARIIEPRKSELIDKYVEKYHALRQRKGIDQPQALRDMRQPYYFGPMMVREGDAEVYVSGRSNYYPAAVRPMLSITSDLKAHGTIAGVYMLVIKNHTYFLTDTAININPSAEQLVQIAEDVHGLASDFGFDPRIALLSFSNFGTVNHETTLKMRKAVQMLWEKHPDWKVDGEMQADAAVSTDLLREQFPFSRLDQGANCLVFPDLNSANIAFRLLNKLGGARTVGPIMTGVGLPMHVLTSDTSVDDIVNIAAIGAVQFNRIQENKVVVPAKGRATSKKKTSKKSAKSSTAKKSSTKKATGKKSGSTVKSAAKAMKKAVKKSKKK
jgi:malate dehydrogenase (oxaloacetate-decarboxylating)(NADP+)